jgi:nucleoside 2-deoxyribosyltransferase
MGGLMMELVKSGVPPDAAAQNVFQNDLRAMERADLLVAVLDGAKVDEDVAFEIGYMFGLGKYCLGLHTDMRRALPTGNNPMIVASLSMTCGSTQALILALKDYCEQRDSGPKIGCGEQSFHAALRCEKA